MARERKKRSDTVRGEDLLIADVERWFVRRGLPHAIDDYSAREDILTRTVPFLSVIFVAEVASAVFGRRFRGMGQLGAALAAALLITVVLAGVNKLRRRPLLRVPDRIGVPELVVFVAVPPMLAAGFDRWVTEALVLAAANAVLLALAFAFAYFGVLPMVIFGLRQVARRLAKLSGLLARVLPILLLFVTFVFLNAEMWQVASDFTPLAYGLVTGALALVAIAFVAVRLPVEIGNLASFDSWEDVEAIATRSTAPPLPLPGPDEAEPNAVLDRKDRRNIAVLLFVSYGVQVVLIGVIVAVALVGLGVLSIRERTIRQWTVQEGAELQTLLRMQIDGAEYVLTRVHLRVAGFISVFAMLQFAVQLMLDADYRREFAADVSEELREILAVQALYQRATGQRDRMR